MADSVTPHDDRTAAILEGVKHAFAEKGFDGASMQDLARAAGMSAGNFYRYFPSKNAIVAAMIARDLADVQRDFEIVRLSNSPADALTQKFVERIDKFDCDDGPLWAEIDAAALRRPEIGEIVHRMEREIGHFLTSIFASIAGVSHAEAQVRFSGQAAFVILLYKGASQRLLGRGCQLPDDTRKDLRRLILNAFDQILVDIAASAALTRKS